MKKINICVAVLALLISGCATQMKPVAVSSAFWKDRSHVIGIASEKPSEPDAHMEGSYGLLDYAIVRGVSEKLINQVKRADLRRANDITKNFHDALSSRGFQVKSLGTIETTNLPKFKGESNAETSPKHDFRSLSEKGVSHILLVAVERVGTVRNYRGFIPIGPPRATFKVKGQLVELQSNKLVWYEVTEASQLVDEPWDNEPLFQNVMSAISKAIEEGSSKFERALFSNPSLAEK